MKLILASSSPRRFELLTQASFIFQVQAPNEVETQVNCQTHSAAQQASILALAKARSVAHRQQSDSVAILLAADTIVALDNHIIGKPRDRDHARKILTMLSGTTHKVITALALLEWPAERCLVEHDVTSVSMAKLSSAQIEEYLDTGFWQGKAGAYAIQKDDVFIRKIDGSFSNVVGLPLELLERMLRDFLPREVVRELKL